MPYWDWTTDEETVWSPLWFGSNGDPTLDHAVPDGPWCNADHPDCQKRCQRNFFAIFHCSNAPVKVAGTQGSGWPNAEKGVRKRGIDACRLSGLGSLPAP